MFCAFGKRRGKRGGKGREWVGVNAKKRHPVKGASYSGLRLVVFALMGGLRFYIGQFGIRLFSPIPWLFLRWENDQKKATRESEQTKI